MIFLSYAVSHEPGIPSDISENADRGLFAHRPTPFGDIICTLNDIGTSPLRTPESSLDLITRAQTGDPQALDALIERYRPRLVR
jgi:hypothetical protein